MTEELEKHLFISYAHRDNQSPIDGQKGWIDVFQHALSVRLGQLLGAKPKIWWDHKILRGNELFAGVIDEGVSKSAVLVPIVSPSYKNSEWCQRELNEFCAAAEQAGGWKLGDRSRIFKVVKTPVPFDEQPDPLPDLLGYEFYRHDAESDRVQEFQIIDPSRVDPEYLQKIDDLADDIRDLIEELIDGEDGHAPDPARDEDGDESTNALDEAEDIGSSTEGPVVYLAESTYDLAEERDAMVRFLKQRGVDVLPAQPLPTYGPDVVSAVREMLATCRLSIHLLGENYARVPEAETRSMIEIQNELAADRVGTNGYCRLFWIPPSIEVSDERQQALIDHLRSDSDAQRGAEILSTSLEALQALVDDKLRPKPALPDEMVDADDLRYLYLICDRRDLAAAETWRDYLYERHADLEVVLPLFDGTEADLRLDHQGNLSTCDGVLLFYGEAPESWLRARLLDLRKAPGYGRTRPFSAKGILDVDPPSSRKARYRTREATVVVVSGSPNDEPLTAFLDELRTEEES